MKYKFSNDERTNKRLTEFESDLKFYDWFGTVKPHFDAIKAETQNGVVESFMKVSRQKHNLLRFIGSIEDSLFYAHRDFAKNFDSEVEKAKKHFEVLVDIAKDLPNFEITYYSIRDNHFWIKLWQEDAAIVYKQVITPILNKLVSKFALSNDGHSVECDF